MFIALVSVCFKSCNHLRRNASLHTCRHYNNLNARLSTWCWKIFHNLSNVNDLSLLFFAVESFGVFSATHTFYRWLTVQRPSNHYQSWQTDSFLFDIAVGNAFKDLQSRLKHFCTLCNDILNLLICLLAYHSVNERFH